MLFCESWRATHDERQTGSVHKSTRYVKQWGGTYQELSLFLNNLKQWKYKKLNPASNHLNRYTFTSLGIKRMRCLGFDVTVRACIAVVSCVCDVWCHKLWIKCYFSIKRKTFFSVRYRVYFILWSAKNGIFTSGVTIFFCIFTSTLDNLYNPFYKKKKESRTKKQ